MVEPPATPGDVATATARSRTADILPGEFGKLQSDAEYIKRDVAELRADSRDVRDRLARLEERVAHLPGKGFIIVVVTTALVITGGLITIAPKLQALLQSPIARG
ncbi:hypothetical protein FNL55_14175 [Tardiphaga sp. vice352]|uniref:hypothetical protein n=1 Tax=unclassified Tardiphaga TaxID=2631404 RepID=UPI001164DEDE|nr:MULTISPECIES: hypothetical protein [unclassified Tardiphaga]MBC7585055.1 hypothetical protein [Tardiphaga sp.]QDM17010.1 hypothetical protein FNL53_14460 [Tardiphaga sp. vice278]QDM21991.1 hypothetical protein FIU28_13120 [Tardiphaga sp. vice154]QDM27245.1 hypothetical protein FNL56_14775 [Tardiphaga sp. vice304]QDM32370.1 hypothetical protein FNL55_14175 [Tardiphaga sp. vice352]